MYEKAIEINQNFADAHRNLGNIHKELGNLEKALTFTLNSLKIDPKNLETHANLAYISTELGDLNQAVQSTMAYLRDRPENSEMLINIMNLYETNMLDEIKYIIKDALKKKPHILYDLNYIEAISSLGKVFAIDLIEFDKSSE